MATAPVLAPGIYRPGPVMYAYGRDVLSDGPCPHGRAWLGRILEAEGIPT